MSDNPTIEDVRSQLRDAEYTINRARSEIQYAYDNLEEANVAATYASKRVQTALDAFAKSVRAHNVLLMRDVALEMKEKQEKHERASDNHGQ